MNENIAVGSVNVIPSILDTSILSKF